MIQKTVSQNINSYQAREHKQMQSLGDLKKAEYVLEASSRFITAFPDNWKSKLTDLLACGQLMEKMMELDFKTTIEELEKIKLDVKQKDSKAILIKPGLLSTVDDNRQYKEDYQKAEPF